MTTSIKMKKEIRIAILGIVLLLAYIAAIFYLYMGTEFGFRDLSKTDYVESWAFADALWNQMYQLGCDADSLQSEEIPSGTLIINTLTYDENLQSMRQGKNAYIGYDSFMDTAEFCYDTDETGVISVSIPTDEVYNSDWYGICLNASDIEKNNRYTVVYREDYISLIMAYAKPNVVYLSDLTDEELLEIIEDPEYNISFLTEDITSVMDGDASINISMETWDEGVTEAEVVEEVRQYANDTDGVARINDSFDDDAYIVWIDGVTLVYSPDEDIFYSNLYGWYDVPNELYFLTDSISEYYDMDADALDDEYLMLVTLPFTDKYSIIREKTVDDYTEHVRAKYDLEYEERNLLYYVVSDSTLYKNVSNLSDITDCDQYIVISREDNGEYSTTLSNFENAYLDDEFVNSMMLNIYALRPDEELYIGIRAGYPYADQFWYTENLFLNYYKFTIPVLLSGILLICLAICMFLSITKQAGRVSGEDKTVYLLFVDKIPVELMFLVGIIGLVCMIYLTLNIRGIMLRYDIWMGDIVSNIALQLLCVYIVMTAYLSLLRRGKAKQMWNWSLVLLTRDMMHRSVRTMAAQKNLVARSVELFLLYWVALFIGLGLLLLGIRWDAVLTFLIGAGLIGVTNIAAFLLLIRQAKGEQLIREVTEELADGDLNVKIPERKVLTTERQILDNIGHLNEGLQKAVEKSVYDERMKAELITNVSHDIKTPLTSIINYVDLIKRERIENENVSHYIEVLDQKSHRLKQLTEDLVEMSRITSGNIELQCMPIDFCELVRQSIGEFEDKFAEHELQIVDSISAEALIIYADGRRTFRIMDNLMQNIYKYAMPKTRVYIDLIKRQDRIVLSIKNISKAALNIDAKELMERFVRGDQSRSTEGSGLGLSIAGDLARIQNGTFDIQLDGDLFKVIIVFPEYVSPSDDVEPGTIK